MKTVNLKLFQLLCFCVGLFLTACQSNNQLEVTLKANLEDLTDKGSRYTPSTQSFLRGHHWLDDLQKATFSINEQSKKASIEFGLGEGRNAEHYFQVKNVPLKQLVPRLHYRTQGEPDRFDRFNLMLAEFSRNGLSFPYGNTGDAITHFETDLQAVIPWKLAANYDFQPNPDYKPVRFSIVNNCLSSGLWELNASDKTGEVYHGWFDFPQDQYFELVGAVNGISPELAKQSLQWSDEEVKIDLDRLRTVKKKLGTTGIAVVDEEISYSSQGSRRKLSKGFVTCEENGQYVRPKKLSDVLRKKVKMSEFIPPGKYSLEKKMDFDFSDFEQPQKVSIREVDPLTFYHYDRGDYQRDELKYIEVQIDLPNNRKLIVGNLPLELLVQQEDFTLHGFGVGILSAGGFAERRQFLIDQGFHPSFAYLAKETSDGLVALNSHGEGLEQVFIRSFPHAEKPHWDITFTSYERITDIVKYRVDINPELIEEQIAHTENYITPVYFSYRDDNLR